MPLDFIGYVEGGVDHLGSDDWLTPASVHGLTDIDFVTLPRTQREELFRRAARFEAVARDAANADGERIAEARTDLIRIWELLRPYRTSESKAVREVLWAVWTAEGVRGWIPTFDYQLGDDSNGDPAVWVWLVLNDGTDIGDSNTRQGLNRLRLLFRAKLQEAGIDRWPYVRTRACAEVARPAVGLRG
jgi:hypothetical protein